MVNLGGDLRTIDAVPADGSGWAVDIEDPFQEGRTVVRLNLSQGGVATSTPRHRRWCSETGSRRHLIDPRTGHPSETDVESVTVVAGEAWIAEVGAKAAALVGTESATALIDDLGLAGIVISDEGRVLTSARFVEFLL
jgi:thiamine biosynthesis lipoprotein